MNVSKGSAPWGMLIAAVFFAILGAVIFALYDKMPELSRISDDYDLISNLDRMGGKTAIAGFFGLFALAFGAWGIYRMAAIRRAAAMPLTLSAEDLNTALQVALEFSDNDLRANKAGQLSEKQKENLGKAFRQNRWLVFGMLLIIVLIIGGVLGFIFFFSPGSELNRKELLGSQEGLIAMGIVGLVLFVILGATFIRAVMNRPADRLTVEQVEGDARLTMNSSGYRYAAFGAICRLRINRRQFYLTESQARGFWNGGRYRIYYIRWSTVPTLLSAEYLG